MTALRIQTLQSHLLQPVELRIDAGELLFLSGPSGSGKSLLLRAIADLDPNTGEVFCGDVARSSLPARAWRRRVGLLPAESGWWEDLVGAHFPDGAAAGASQADLEPLLARLGFAPDVLGWTVTRLSTGERQRLALARLLAHRPEVLLLDEATANLDPENRTRVEGVVADYRVDRAAAVLWVSHDPEQRLRMNGRRLVIDGGQLLPEVDGAQDGHGVGENAWT
jgi:putative ABC transport system ATP-binding protein